MTELEPRRPRTELGANSEGAAAHNRRVVMQALRLNGPLSRAAIARGTGLVPQTASNIIGELEAEGFVVATEPVRSGRARPSIPYEVVADAAHALGMQVDQHGARLVAVNLLGDIVAKARATFSQEPLECNLAVMLAEIEALIAALPARQGNGDARVVGLGLAMPAPTGVHALRNDPWMMASREHHPLAEAIAQAVGVPVSVHHDAGAAAIAERLNGVARGMDDFVYIFVGYGLGAGINIKGDLYNGANDLAGEIGQIPVWADGPMAPVEQYASLAPLLQALKLKPSQPDLFERLETAMNAGAPGILEWAEQAGTHLGWLATVTACVVDPVCIVLGGQMPPPLLGLLHERVTAAIGNRGASVNGTMPPVLQGSSDPFLVAAGAASYPIARAFEPRFSAMLKSVENASALQIPWP